jgi:mRNA interferase RelE/StbE
MADYAVTFARSARKELESLEAKLVQRIWTKIEAFTTDSRPTGCKKLVGTNDLWRIRVGEYRVIYTIDDRSRVVDVVAVRHRRDAYR